MFTRRFFSNGSRIAGSASRINQTWHLTLDQEAVPPLTRMDQVLAKAQLLEDRLVAARSVDQRFSLLLESMDKTTELLAQAENRHLESAELHEAQLRLTRLDDTLTLLYKQLEPYLSSSKRWRQMLSSVWSCFSCCRRRLRSGPSS